MSTTIPGRLDGSTDPSATGVERSESGGRAKRGAGGGRSAWRRELAAGLKALLPDELIDELLAGARTEEEIAGPGRVAVAADEAAGGAGAGGRADRPPRLRAAPGAARRGWQHAERVDPEDVDDRAWARSDRDAARPEGDVRAADRPEAAAAVRGLRRQDPGPVRPRSVDPRHRGAPGGDLRGQVGRDLISRVTDAVIDDARAWQTRPLDDVYPVVFLDALVLKVRDGGIGAAQGLLPGAGDHHGRRP